MTKLRTSYTTAIRFTVTFPIDKIFGLPFYAILSLRDTSNFIQTSNILYTQIKILKINITGFLDAFSNIAGKIYDLSKVFLVL